MPDIGALLPLVLDGQRVMVLYVVEVDPRAELTTASSASPNLRSSTLDGDIIRAPHVTGARVIALDEEAATAQTDNHCGVARPS